MTLRFTILLTLLVLTINAKKFSSEEHWQEFEEFLQWKKERETGENGSREVKYDKYYKNRDMGKTYERDQQVPVNNPPPIDQAALMARYIVNQADWVAVSTISSRREIQSFPAVTLVSYADGTLGNGSGIPYLYLTPLDFTAQDLAKDNRASLLMTLAQGKYCKSNNWDPMDPRCARVLLTGKVKTLKNESTELQIAKKAFFERHPGLVNMPADHYFYFAKLKIMSIVVLDTFGGPKYVNVKDYLHPPTTNVTEEFYKFFPLSNYEAGSQQPYNPISNMLNPAVQRI